MTQQLPQEQQKLFEELRKSGGDDFKDKLKKCFASNKQSFDLCCIHECFNSEKLHQIRRILLEFLGEGVHGDGSWDHNAVIELMLTIGTYFRGIEVAPILTKLNPISHGKPGDTGRTEMDGERLLPIITRRPPPQYIGC